MKKKTKKRVIACVTALILAGAVFVGIGTDGFRDWDAKTWFNSWGTEQPATDDKTSGGLDFDFSEGEANNGVSYMIAKIPRSAYPANNISDTVKVAYSITATLIPDNVDNKLVDWSLVWGDDESPVTTCASLNIPSDGSLTVTLSLLSAFPDRDMKLICTSRDSGVSGFLFVRCEGIPTSITVGGSESSITGCRWGNTNTYAINLTNEIGYISESQYSKITVASVTLHGTATSYGKYFLKGDLGPALTSLYQGVTPNWSEGSKQGELSEYFPNAVQASISEHNLVITVANSVISYGKYTANVMQNGASGVMFENVVIGKQNETYAEIVLQIGELEKTFRVDFTVSVTGVVIGDDIVI